jgi:hypothetical protein
LKKDLFKLKNYVKNINFLFNFVLNKVKNCLLFEFELIKNQFFIKKNKLKTIQFVRLRIIFQYINKKHIFKSRQHMHFILFSVTNFLDFLKKISDCPFIVITL